MRVAAHRLEQLLLSRRYMEVEHVVQFFFDPPVAGHRHLTRYEAEAGSAAEEIGISPDWTI